MSLLVYYRGKACSMKPLDDESLMEEIYELPSIQTTLRVSVLVHTTYLEVNHRRVGEWLSVYVRMLYNAIYEQSIVHVYRYDNVLNVIHVCEYVYIYCVYVCACVCMCV